MTVARPHLLLGLVTCLILAPAFAGAESLDRVKELYRSAAYEEALALLDQMRQDAASPGSIEESEYRLLCLIALDRKADARTAIESMMDADPFYELTQASPRVRAAFKEIRQSLLPDMVERAYGRAKASFDREDPEAVAEFERVLALLSDPDIASAPKLADLRTVAEGFRDLSKVRAARPEPPAAAPLAAPPAAAPAVAAAPGAPVVYREGEPGLVPPVVVNQVLPRWFLPPGFSTRESREWQGTVEIVIDENGDVIASTLRKSFHPAYDAQLINASRFWKYRPARRSGTPVRFLKLINVRFDSTN